MTEQNQSPAEVIFSDFRSAGGRGSSIYEMSSRNQDSREAIEVSAERLIHLEERGPGEETDERSMARECIIRTLGCRKARKTTAVPALISQFDIIKNVSDNIRWTAGISLYDIPAGKEYFDELTTIVNNRDFGSGRQMVVDWLGKSQHPDAATVALSQLSDESVQGHALEALARLRAQGIREQVEPFTRSKNKWHKRTAERIIRNLKDE